MKAVTVLANWRLGCIFLSFLIFTAQADEETLQEDPNLYVKLALGELRGSKEVSTDGKEFYSFRGIPYAKAPVGSLRFKDPEDAEPWNGTLDATDNRKTCFQFRMLNLPKFGYLNEAMIDSADEDCLFLNVYTPEPNSRKSDLPVMVYIHGGAFFCGSAREYGPYALMNEDIVLVVMQYRLGTLGFLSTEDDVMPGNLGLKDQTLALKWVQKHISAFGGNPVRVTIFGESAGGASVHYQILSPQSIGLFSRAILQSGTALCPWAMGGAHLETAHYIGRYFHCSTEEGSEELLKCLQNVPAANITGVYALLFQWGFLPLVLGPRVDGKVLPNNPEVLLKEGRQKKMDIMIGVTKHEGALFTLFMYSNEGMRWSLTQNFEQMAPIAFEFSEGDIAPLNQSIKIFDKYIGDLRVDANSADAITNAFSDRHFKFCSDITAIYHDKNVRSHKRRTFKYEFQHKGQYSFTDFFVIDIGRHWVSHVDDLFYLFSGEPLFPPLTTEEDLKMGSIMTKMWTNFAKFGNPTPDDSLGFTWEDTSEDKKYLSIKSPLPEMKEDQWKETREFWSSLPTRQNLVLFPEKIDNLVKGEPFAVKKDVELEEQQKEPLSKEGSEEVIGETIEEKEKLERKEEL